MKRYPLLESASGTVQSPKSTPETSMKESEDKKMMIKKVNRFFLLPDDILIEILKRVPDAYLRYKVKYVCRRWFDIIRNTILLDHASFIIQELPNPLRLVDVWEERQGLQVKEQYLDITQYGMIRFSYNEFLLMSVSKLKESLYVLNLITKEGTYLPRCKVSCKVSFENHCPSRCGLALSFDRFKRIYKVVHLFMGPPLECEILVLSGDVVSRANTSEWKKIQVPYTNTGKHIWINPASVQDRYLHWKIVNSKKLLSVDMVEEKVRRMSLPGSHDHGRSVYSFFEMGGFLAFFDGDKSEVWVLKDFHRVKWEKLQSITVNNSYFERYPDKFEMYRFRGMISKRYLILESRVETGMYSYDLKYGVVKELDILMDQDNVCRVVHSLAPSFL